MARTWTKDAPAGLVNPEGDWYWWRGAEESLRALEVVSFSEGLMVRESARDSEYYPLASYPGEWLGPITPEDVARADAFEPVTFGWETEPCITQSGGKFTGEGMIERHQQYQADAAVGRKLREISEAVGRADLLEIGFCDGRMNYVNGPYPDARSARPGHSGPDALDRAHAEVCGSEGAPFNLGTVDGRYSAPAKPDFTCAACSARVTTGFSDGKSGFLCCLCWDECGRPSEFSLLACEAVMPPPAKPDYARWTDRALAFEAGVVVDSDDVTLTPTLRAACIAFLEQR